MGLETNFAAFEAETRSQLSAAYADRDYWRRVADEREMKPRECNVDWKRAYEQADRINKEVSTRCRSLSSLLARERARTSDLSEELDNLRAKLAQLGA